MTKPEPIGILLVDDHEVVRRGLAALLEENASWTIVGEAADGRSAVQLAQELQPDVIVMDVAMPELNGFEATRRIRKLAPDAEVLILTMHDSEQLVREVIDAGARGYVLKSDAGRQLVAAVRSLAKHRPYFTSQIAAKVYDEFRRPPRVGRPPAVGLTPREREVLQLLAEGNNNREVAERLGCSVKTIETHRARIIRKLGVGSLAELVRYALREGIVS
ncbi:MAG TPA: response regulator transcription factor [Chthoniobacteraceae bacterium]|nr:response regulator transcription factor [Chthoniobacteraceae bacterium]